MDKDISLGEAELEIMKVLWKEGKPVNTQFINRAVEKKGWKRTTVSTFLTRLVVKGALAGEKIGNTFYYTALISKKEYRKAKTKSLISSLYEDSVKEFTVALFEDNDMSQSDIDEMKAFINSLEDK